MNGLPPQPAGARATRAEKAEGSASRDWNAYPILRFSGVPPVEVELIAAEYPGLGVGEATIGNAVTHAFKRRLYDMPLMRQRIVAALLV